MNSITAFGQTLLAGVLLALLPAAPALAETAFFGGFSEGAVPGTVSAGDSGTQTFGLMGIWMDPLASGDTRVEVTLPEYVEFTGALTGKVWAKTWASSREQNALLRLRGEDGSMPISTESDFACNLYGYDIDPTTGDMYVILGRSGSVNCYRSTNRWLARYDTATGMFKWIGAVGNMRGLEFLPSGVLLATGANGAPNGMGSVHEVNKSTGGLTYRAAPAVGNSYRDWVYNPGDGMLYGAERCYVIRLNPSNWAHTSEYRGEMCNLRRTSVDRVTDNVFLVRDQSAFYKLEVNPTTGAFVSWTSAGSHGWYVRAPMVVANFDPTSVAKSCSLLSARAAACTYGSVVTRAAVAAEGMIKYTIPADAKPGIRTGEARWLRGATVLKTQPINIRILSPDVEVAMTPASGRYLVNDTFTITVDMTAVGGKDVNDVELNVAIPSAVLTVTSIGGTGTCGLSRNGIRCTGIDIAADATQTLNIGVRADADGYAAVNAAVSVAAGDVDSSNDTAASSFVVGNATDLVATGTKGGAGKIGTAMDLEIEVTNEGPDAAVNSVLTLPGDAGFDVGTATTDTGACAASGTGVRCVFGTMAVDTTATVNVKVTPTRSGNLTFPAAATSDVLDVTPGNNTYAFEVSVPTLPFTIALGAAQPSSSRGDVRSVLQLAVTPDPKAESGVRLTEISGSLKISAEGLNLKSKVYVFEDLDANGVYDETDPFVGTGSLSATDGSFSIAFPAAITAPAKKTTHFILAVQAQGAPRIAGVPFGTSPGDWMAAAMVGLLSLAFAGFAFGRRRAGVAALGLMVLSLVGACSEEDKAGSSTKVAATVTSVSASLLDDPNSPVEALGLPIAGPTVTLSR